MTVLLNLDFEENNLSDFDTTVINVSLAASAAAALVGSYGVAVGLDSSALSSRGENTLTVSTNVIRYRFYFDPNGLSMGSADNFVMLQIHADGTLGGLINFSFVRLAYASATTYDLRFQAYDDAGGSNTIQSAAFSDDVHYCEVQIERATTNSAADGTLSAWVDGVSAGTPVTNLDNFDLFATIDETRFGAVTSLDTTTSGTIYIDDFILNDDGSLIGAAGGGGGPTPVSFPSAMIPTATDGTIDAVIRHDAGTGAPYYTHIDEGVSGVGTDYVQNDTSETSGAAAFSFSDMPTDFDTIATLSINVVRQAISFSNDTCIVTAQVFASDQTTPYTDAVTVALETNTTKAALGITAFTVNATGLAATKANWNAAYIKLSWNYTKTGGPDNGQISVFALEMTGTYYQAGANIALASAGISIAGLAAAITGGAVSKALNTAIMTIAGIQAIISTVTTIQINTAALVIDERTVSITVGAVSIDLLTGSILFNGQPVTIDAGAFPVSINLTTGSIGIGEIQAAIAAGAVSIQLATGTLNIDEIQSAISTGAVSIDLLTGNILINGQPAALQAGLVSIPLNVANLVINERTISITGVGEIALNTAGISLIGQAANIQTAAVIVPLNTAAIVADERTISIIGGAAIIPLASAAMGLNGQLINLLAGAVSIPLNTASLPITGNQAAIDAGFGPATIALNTAGISVAELAANIVSGVVSIDLATAAVQINGQAASVFGVAITTPDGRIFAIISDDRVYAINNNVESRDLAINDENRKFVINEDE